MSEPFDWGNPWDGTEFESIIDELIEKTDKNAELIDELKEECEGLRYDFESFKNDTIKMVTNILKNLHEN